MVLIDGEAPPQLWAVSSDRSPDLKRLLSWGVPPLLLIALLTDQCFSREFWSLSTGEGRGTHLVDKVTMGKHPSLTNSYSGTIPTVWQPSLMAEYWLLNISGVIWPWLLFKNLLNCDISIYFHPLSPVCPSGGPERTSSWYTAWPNRKRKVLYHLAVHPHFVSTVYVAFLSWTFPCPDSKSTLCFSRVKATTFPKWSDLLHCYHWEQNLQRLKSPKYIRIQTYTLTFTLL